MEEGLGPGVVAAVGEISQGGGPAVFGDRRFLVDIWGLAESLVPAYTSSSIGKRDIVSPSEMGSGSCVSGDCDVLSWLPRLFSRKSSLGAESWSCCNTLQSACDELCGQGSAGMSMSSACFGFMVLSVSLWDMSRDDSEADMKSCGHLYSVQVCVCHLGGLAHITEN